MRVRDQSCGHVFVALQASSVGIHFRSLLSGARPRFRIGLTRRVEVHFVAGDAGEIAAAKTGRRLYAVEFASGPANASLAPESVVKKIRLRPGNEIFLFGVIRSVGLHHEPLREFARTGTKSSSVSIEIDLVRHVVESPDAVTLPASEAGFGPFQICRVRDRRVRLCREMNFETAKRIPIAGDVLASFAVAGFAGNPELGDLRVPLKP